ncbi:DUF916 and DUF3324 domain-containing protein [Enterococcus faecalis]|nr:DUF916 and DUF3324 domain-containing protein [Enterococcus faecalis]
MNKKKIFLMLMMIAFSFLIGIKRVAASNVDYSIIPQPSDKQVSEENTYYDLKLNKNEKEDLKIKVKNNSNKEIIIETNVDKATTNSNGVVEYKNSNKHKSTNLKHDITEFVKADKSSVVLLPYEEKEITYKITQPEENFEGIIVGGINFTQKLTDNSEVTGSMAVKNQYSYSIAIVLHGSKDTIKHDVTNNKVELRQSNGRNIIYFPILNNTAAFLNKVNVTGAIYKQNENKAIYTEKVSNAQVAPNSIYEYPIGTSQTKLHPGKYLAKVSIESKGEKWEFTDKFEITEAQSKKLNSTGVIDKKNYTKYILLAAIIVLIILLFLFLILYIRKKNKEIKELQKYNHK